MALLAAVPMNFFIANQAFAETELDNTIIVTARRIDERLQDVPISITVIDAKRMESANIVNAEDLAKVVPGLSIQSRYSSDMSSFAIRGFSQELRTSAAVATYFADVVAPRAGSSVLQGADGGGAAYLFDLQNVQVLKGPQGTLFGRNTTGGAVLLVPRKPTDRFEGYVEGALGNYDMERLQAVVNVPISDGARLRLGMDRMTRTGYLKNVSGIGPSDFADVDYIAARASLVVDLSTDIENYTIGSFYESDTSGSSGQIFAANPSLFFGTLAAPQVARLNASGNFYQIEQSAADAMAWTRQWQVINTLTWHASSSITIKNITSYSRVKQKLKTDLYGTNFSYYPGVNWSAGAAYTAETYLNDQKNFTNEVQIQGISDNGKLNWQAGLYYENSSPGSFVGSLSPTAGTVCKTTTYSSIEEIRCLPPGLTTGAGIISYNRGTIKFINMGAYAQATYALTDQLKATAGLRYTYDRTRGRLIGLRYILSNDPANPSGFGIPGTPVCQNMLVGDCTHSSSTSSKKPTWTLNLAYNPLQNIMLYGTYSRGYRQGSAAPFSTISLQTFGPETVDSFEIGAKTSFDGQVSGMFNAAAFYSKLKNQQLLFALIGLGGSQSTSVLNAGRSRMYGVEFDGSIRFADMFKLSAGATYVNSRLQSMDPPGPFPGLFVFPTAVAGDDLPYTPKWTANLTGTVMLPVPESIGSMELSATYRHQSAFSTSASSTGPLRTTEVNQLDLNLAWNNVANGPVDVSLFATNATNQKTVVHLNQLLNSFGFNSRYLGQPRMWGARMKVRFGGNAR